MKSFIDYLCNEDGQTSTEYILLVVVVVMMVVKFKSKLTTKLNELTDTAFGKANGLVGEIQ